jgi:hypothetical protein
LTTCDVPFRVWVRYFKTYPADTFDRCHLMATPSDSFVSVIDPKYMLACEAGCFF